MVNINFGRSKSKIVMVIFTKIIFAIELEFAKSAKFTARENFALYGTYIHYQSTFCPLDWMSFTGHCHATSPLTGTGVINKS